MTRGSLRLAATAISLLAGLLVVAPTAHAAGSTVRILLEGDSITQGFNGDYSWRYRFDKELVRQGATGVDLVGSKSLPYVKPGYSTSQYIDPHFDSAHYARVGSTLAEHANEVQAEIGRVNPDVIVLAAGVNDLRGGLSPATAESRLRTWISRARAAKSDIKIVISPVLDATDPSRPGLPSAISQFRAREADVVADLSTSQSPISLADTNRGWSVSAYTYDHLHPTPTGETLIAQRIAEKLDQLGYVDFPQAINIFKPTPWARVAVAHAKVVGRNVQITWDQQAITGSRVWMRRVGSAGKVQPGVHGGGIWTSPRLQAGARYEFRIQMVKATLASPYGPIVRVTVGRGSAPSAVARVVVTARNVHWTRAAGATGYVVRYRKFHSSRWHTRTTHRLAVRAKRVKEARVRAVNGAGTSPVRYGRR